MSELKQLTDDQLKVVERVQKMLNLAAKNPNPAEAEVAQRMAEKLMLEHNLEAATVEAASGGKARREQALTDGGFYAWQRELWRAVAEVHFCMYFSQQYLTKDPVPQTVKENGVYLGVRKVRVMRRRHMLIGRAVNTRLAVNAAQYLQGEVARSLRARLAGDGEASERNQASKWANDFRKGVARTLVSRLEARRSELVAKEEQAARRAERAAGKASSGTALTVAAFSKSEEEANYDFHYGEGAWARKAARIAQRAAEREQEMAEYTQWCKDHPEEAAKQQAEWDKQQARNARRRTGRRFSGFRKDGTDMGAYYAGMDAGETIGLDVQAEGRREAKKLAGSKDIHL